MFRLLNRQGVNHLLEMKILFTGGTFGVKAVKYTVNKGNLIQNGAGKL